MEGLPLFVDILWLTNCKNLLNIPIAQELIDFKVPAVGTFSVEQICLKQTRETKKLLRIQPTFIGTLNGFQSSLPLPPRLDLTGTAEDLLIGGGAMRIFNHCHYAISLEIDCFYALLTRQICA